MSWKRAITRSFAEVSARTIGAGLRPGFRVLLYHSVGGALRHDPYGISIAPALFEKQMDLLAAGDHLTLTSFADALAPTDSLQIAVTFDDGYRDNLHTAAPLLVARRIPFTVFVTTSFVRNNDPDFLSPTELRELASMPGVQIGSHGATHARMAALDDAALRRELEESRRELEDMTGKEVRLVAYPHGSVNLRVREVAARAGYARGGTSRFGINTKESDPLLLSRCEVVASDTLRVFRQKLAGAWDWYRWRTKDPSKQ